MTQNLVSIGMGAVTARFMVLLTDAGEPRPRRLPAESFDMQFFATVVGARYQAELTGKLLGGMPIGEATGWL